MLMVLVVLYNKNTKLQLTFFLFDNTSEIAYSLIYNLTEKLLELIL